ncbi:unnamed protein product [Lymnaea stagnalis]|uniref:Uncharacterized protein n=1 Tax=Lymnaea stagnalis TaxID=6523 RepID=A0AAV2HA88_LYMST
MDIFRAASTLLKIAIIAFALGLLLFIIGFATNSWKIGFNLYPFGYGLWNYFRCDRGCVNYPISQPNDFHSAIQAMECLGLIGFGLALLILLLYLCADSCRRRHILQVTTALAFAGILFACIGFALFGSNDMHNIGRSQDVGWSMGIAIAGTVIYAIGGIMLIVQLVR